MLPAMAKHLIPLDPLAICSEDPPSSRLFLRSVHMIVELGITTTTECCQVHSTKMENVLASLVPQKEMCKGVLEMTGTSASELLQAGNKI